MFDKMQSSLTSVLTFFGDNLFVQAVAAILLSLLAATLFKRVIIVA